VWPTTSSEHLFRTALAGGARGASLEAVEDEQLAIAVDLADQLGERIAALPGDVLHVAPECLFEAHAGLVTVQNDGSLNDWDFMALSPKKETSQRQCDVRGTAMHNPISRVRSVLLDYVVAFRADLPLTSSSGCFP